MKKVRELFRYTFGYCEMCKRYLVYPKKRHMNTCYVDEESNYCRVCKRCFGWIEERWEEAWDEYNSERY